MRYISILCKKLVGLVSENADRMDVLEDELFDDGKIIIFQDFFKIVQLFEPKTMIVFDQRFCSFQHFNRRLLEYIQFKV